MTIAACYLSPEGVVLGADSTTTHNQADGSQFFLDYSQKIFEVGKGSTLGMVFWGLGTAEYRRLVAELGDEIVNSPAKAIDQLAESWKEKFWDYYENTFSGELAAARALHVNPNRTAEQQKILDQLLGGLKGGFCLAGRTNESRSPRAFLISYGPLADRTRSLSEIKNTWMFWGCPNIVNRLVFGIDENMREAIANSPDWSGGKAALDAICNSYNLQPPIVLPLREAVDWVHSMLYSTVKLFKFSSLPVCGGPIEIAVITSDRPFRWIKHKTLTEAISPSPP